MLFDRFTETIFLKEGSDLQDKLKALTKLKEKYPDNKDLQEEWYIVKKGLDGENEIRYELSKANLGLYVLHDVNFQYGDLKAQVDYIVITKYCCYFIECKNLMGNITVDEKGNFIREYTYNGEKIKKGIYSPLRQVEAQRDVYKKIWNISLSKNSVINSFKRALAEKNFTDIHKVLFVLANKDTILNIKKAPGYVYDRVIKADQLIKRIQNDIEFSDKKYWDNQKGMYEWAMGFMKRHKYTDIDYEKYYTKKFIDKDNDDSLGERLIEFRKTRAEEKNIPEFYVFNNEELEALIKLKPETIEELEEANVLNEIRFKMHGESIIDVINKE